MQRIRADQPDDMWTTVPPAKSMASLGLGVARAVDQPVDAPDHVGERKVDEEHPADEEEHQVNFIRSAIAPTMSAGVMMANMSWYIANTLCETQAP